MEELASRFSGIALLCRKYREHVLCIHQERGTETLQSNYDRGRVRPLLLGAASVAILAYIPAYQLGRLYNRIPEEFDAAGFGKSLAEVKANLKDASPAGLGCDDRRSYTRSGGYCGTLFDGEHDVLGSLSLTVREIPDDAGQGAADSRTSRALLAYNFQRCGTKLRRQSRYCRDDCPLNHRQAARSVHFSGSIAIWICSPTSVRTEGWARAKSCVSFTSILKSWHSPRNTLALTVPTNSEFDDGVGAVSDKCTSSGRIDSDTLAPTEIPAAH